MPDEALESMIKDGVLKRVPKKRIPGSKEIGTCKDCKFYVINHDRPGYGVCGSDSARSTRDIGKDQMGFEFYKEQPFSDDGIHVGPDFGCIHFELRVDHKENIRDSGICFCSVHKPKYIGESDDEYKERSKNSKCRFCIEREQQRKPQTN